MPSIGKCNEAMDKFRSFFMYLSIFVSNKVTLVTEESHAGICVYLSLKQSQETGSFVHMGAQMAIIQTRVFTPFYSVFWKSTMKSES